VLRQCAALIVTVVALLCFPAELVAQEGTASEWELWSALHARFDRSGRLDASVEYQVRIDDNFSELSSHFFEGLGYVRLTEGLEVASGYRVTKRPDHTEQRFALLGWWRTTVGEGRPSVDGDELTLTHHLGLQHDWNVKPNDTFINSSSLRYVVTFLKPVTPRIAPFITGGALTTWNEEFDFGVEIVRAIVGVRINRNATDRLKLMYMFQYSRTRDPAEISHVAWIRYEILMR
jgi:hypothetical protein